MTGELVLPIGHYLGPVARADNPVTVDHRVRVGYTVRVLRHGDPYNIWLLARGGSTRPDDTPWAGTREALAEAAGLTPERLRVALANLERAGLVAEVDPADPEPFAQRFRLCPLLAGLGQRPEWRGWYALGLADEPLAMVTGLLYQTWQLSAIAPSLWTVAEQLAQLDGDTDPETLLGSLVRGLHLLLSGQAGYLDEVIDGQ